MGHPADQPSEGALPAAAAPPFGAAGTVSYGPNVNDAAILLGIEGNVPVERTAHLMAALLGAPVSTGFVARALERFAQRLAAAGFDEAMKTALRAEDVLCADETPTNVIHKDTDEQGQPLPGPRTRSRCAPPMRGWSGMPRSAPDPRPPSPLWVYSTATPGTWSEMTTSVGTSPSAPPGRSAKSFWLVMRCFEGWDVGLGCSGAGVGCS